MVSGWNNFTGGSNAASECIPDIPPGIVGFSGASEFFCSSGGYTVNVLFSGGVLPIFWATNIGKIDTTGPRTATVKIHSAVGSPITFLGYAGDVRNANTATCFDADGYAYVRLGEELRSKGVDNVCHHDCNFLGYSCAGVPNVGDTACGDNILVADPAVCPYNEATLAGSIYGTPGKCFGPCMKADAVIFDYPPLWYVDVTSPPIDYAACGQGKPYQTPIDFPAIYAGSGGPIFDTRHPELLKKGCAPCALVRSLDAIITAVDAAGNVVIQDIHINP